MDTQQGHASRQQAPVRGEIQSYTARGTLAAGTRAALEGLGYRFRRASRSAANPGAQTPGRVCIVDDHGVGELPSLAAGDATPIIRVSASRSRDTEDPRIIAWVKRPASLSDLYPIFQNVLEEHPRRVPRVATELPARCVRADHRWPAAVVSLSEGGCLIQSSERIACGDRLNLQFAFPNEQLINARARCCYLQGSYAAFVFVDPDEPVRERIHAFVQQRLAAR